MVDEVVTPSETPSSSYNKRPLWQWVLLYVVLALVVYGLVYYFVFAKKGTSNQTGSMYQTPTQAVTVQPTQAASPSAAATANQVTVVGTEFSFTPSTVTVKMGQPVTLTFKNNGTYPHNLTISQLQVATKTIQPGQQDTVTFTPSQKGSFPFLCTVPGHADRGMKGTLVVQ